MENKFKDLSHEQKLKVVIFNEVRKICEEIGKSTNFHFERKSMDLISELVWRKIRSYGEDLEAFAKHAKRTTVNNDDIKLLVRKNILLKEHIAKMAEEQSAGKKGKQKKENASADSESSVPNSRAQSPATEVFDVE